MTPKRKKAQEFILKYVDKIAPGGINKKLYTDLFDSMTDKKFDDFMVGLRDKTITLCIIVPHDDSVKVSVKRNLAIGKELGYEFYQRLWVVDPGTGEKYLTPNRYLVFRLPIRRAAQLLSKGISIPKDNKHINMLTGQVSGPSKSSMLTMPETQLLSAMGLKHTTTELMKYRGGDMGAKNALTNILYKHGRVDGATLDQHSTGVVSTKTLKYYLLGAHIRSEGLDNK